MAERRTNMKQPTNIVSVQLGGQTFYLCGFKQQPFQHNYKVRLTSVKQDACRFWNASAARAQTWAKGFRDAIIEKVN